MKENNADAFCPYFITSKGCETVFKFYKRHSEVYKTETTVLPAMCFPMGVILSLTNKTVGSCWFLASLHAWHLFFSRIPVALLENSIANSFVLCNASQYVFSVLMMNEDKFVLSSVGCLRRRNTYCVFWITSNFSRLAGRRVLLPDSILYLKPLLLLHTKSKNLFLLSLPNVALEVVTHFGLFSDGSVFKSRSGYRMLGPIVFLDFFQVLQVNLGMAGSKRQQLRPST
jgi:hypothetical protein